MREVTVEEAVEAVKLNPGKPTEYYVGFLSTRGRSYASARRAIRRALRDGKLIRLRTTEIYVLEESRVRRRE